MRIPLPSSRPGRRASLSIWDAFVATVTPLLALYLRDAQILSHDSWESLVIFCLLSTSFSVLAIFAFRIQDGVARYFSVHDAIDIAKAVVLAVLVTLVVLFTLTRLDGIPRSTPLIHGLLLAAGLAAGRILVRIKHHEEDVSPKYQFSRERIILIGANRFAAFFIKLLNAYTPHQQRVVAVLDDRPAMVGRAISGVRILGTPEQLESIIAEFAIHGVSIERIVIAGDAAHVGYAAMREIRRVCEIREIELSSLPQMIGATHWNAAKPEETPLRASQRADIPPVKLSRYFFLKRWIDIFGSLLLILLFMPVFVIAGLLVLLDVGAPVLFWQERLGRNGRPFLIYKFRTLRPPFDCEGNPVPEHGQISPIGRALRATHVDELPQLFNVLMGDMSLIGPRPLLPEDQPLNAK